MSELIITHPVLSDREIVHDDTVSIRGCRLTSVRINAPVVELIDCNGYDVKASASRRIIMFGSEMTRSLFSAAWFYAITSHLSETSAVAANLQLSYGWGDNTNVSGKYATLKEMSFSGWIVTSREVNATHSVITGRISTPWARFETTLLTSQDHPYAMAQIGGFTVIATAAPWPERITVDSTDYDTLDAVPAHLRPAAELLLQAARSASERYSSSLNRILQEV